MNAQTLWHVLADGVLALHLAVVLFVIGGALAVVAGALHGWPWVRAPLWRWAHLAAIGVVVVQAWLGADCPLTRLELWLRVQAGGAAGGGLYAQGFIGHWLQRLLYWQAPPWVFVVGYTVFGLGVLGLWWRFPPRPWRRSGLRHGHDGDDNSDGGGFSR